MGPYLYEFLQDFFVNVMDTLDSSFIDITTEFLCVAFHGILYHTSVYPKSIFESRRKYNIVVYRSIHPEVNQYIDLCLKQITECFMNNQISCVEFAVTDSEHVPIIKFMFQFEENRFFDETLDAYMIQAEQNLRAYCLKLASMSDNFNDLPDDSSFSIHIHTNESTAMSLVVNPESEEFPLVEMGEKKQSLQRIIPIRRFSVRNHFIDTYIEVK